MDISLEEERRVLQSGLLEMKTLAATMRQLITRGGLKVMLQFYRGCYGLHLNGQMPRWNCPNCGVKKFCPLLRLPYHMEVECDAGVVVCGKCRHCEVMPVRLGRWGAFGTIERPVSMVAKPVLLPAPAPVEQPLIVSEELPSLAVAADLIRLQDACGRFRPTACNFVGPDRWVRKASQGKREVGFSLYSFSPPGVCWWDVATMIPSDAAVVGRALFLAMVHSARIRGKLKLSLKLLHTYANVSILTACGIVVPPRRGDYLRLTVPLHKL